MAGFYDEGALRHIALNLFNGWGYNFYRAENQLRADDQLVRSKADWLLGQARAAVGAADSTYRREAFGTPTRDKPLPDPAVVENARRIERLGAAIGGIAGRLQAQPAPEADRMSQRYRREAATLKALIVSDEQLVGQCALLQQLADAPSPVALLERLGELQEGVKAIEATLRGRETILLS
ncbi:MAG TPA: hypothetical protein VGN52_17580 [Burkholderiales bacterium]